MAYGKLDVLLNRFSEWGWKSTHFLSVASSSFPGPAWVYTELFHLQKRWIMLSLIPSSLSWKRSLTVSIRLAGELCVKHPGLCVKVHISAQGTIREHLHVCQVFKRLEHTPLYVFNFYSFYASRKREKTSHWQSHHSRLLTANTSHN